ncbi:MAG: hypothetical protein MJ060_04305 [Clostridia bacterium]|nr:hypothetical protein [Clostridia bacterium]
MPNAEQTQLKAQVDFYFYELKQEMRALERMQIKLASMLDSSLSAPDPDNIGASGTPNSNKAPTLAHQRIKLETKLKERTKAFEQEWNYALTICSKSKGVNILWHAKIHGLTNQELSQKYGISQRQIRRNKWKGYVFFYRNLPQKYQK